MSSSINSSFSNLHSINKSFKNDSKSQDFKKITTVALVIIFLAGSALTIAGLFSSLSLDVYLAGCGMSVASFLILLIRHVRPPKKEPSIWESQNPSLETTRSTSQVVNPVPQKKPSSASPVALPDSFSETSLSAGLNVNPTPKSAHSSFLNTDRAEDLAEFIEENPLLQKEEWIPYLHSAAKYCENAEIFTILASKVSIDAVDKEGKTALHYAVIYNNRSAIDYLIQLKAQSIKDFAEKTPYNYIKDRELKIYYLRLTSYENDVESLVDRGLSWFLRSYHNEPALIQKARFLIILGLDVNQKDASNDDFTLLHCAAALDFSQLITFLCQNGADVDILNKELQSPLFLAARNKKTKSLSTLLELDANPDIPGINGQTPLFKLIESSKNCNTEIITHLLDSKKIDLSRTFKTRLVLDNKNIEVNLGYLHFAIDKLEPDIVKLLITHRIDVNAPTSEISPLAFCFFRGFMEALPYFLAQESLQLNELGHNRQYLHRYDFGDKGINLPFCAFSNPIITLAEWIETIKMLSDGVKNKIVEKTLLLYDWNLLKVFATPNPDLWLVHISPFIIAIANDTPLYKKEIEERVHQLTEQQLQWLVCLWQKDYGTLDLIDKLLTITPGFFFKAYKYLSVSLRREVVNICKSKIITLLDRRKLDEIVSEIQSVEQKIDQLNIHASLKQDLARIKGALHSENISLACWVDPQAEIIFGAIHLGIKKRHKELSSALSAVNALIAKLEKYENRTAKDLSIENDADKDIYTYLIDVGIQTNKDYELLNILPKDISSHGLHEGQDMAVLGLSNDLKYLLQKATNSLDQKDFERTIEDLRCIQTWYKETQRNLLSFDKYLKAKGLKGEGLFFKTFLEHLNQLEVAISKFKEAKDYQTLEEYLVMLLEFNRARRVEGLKLYLNQPRLDEFCEKILKDASLSLSDFANGKKEDPSFYFQLAETQL